MALKESGAAGPSGSINKSVHTGRFFHSTIAHEAPARRWGARLKASRRVRSECLHPMLVVWGVSGSFFIPVL